MVLVGIDADSERERDREKEKERKREREKEKDKDKDKDKERRDRSHPSCLPLGVGRSRRPLEFAEGTLCGLGGWTCRGRGGG